ncbi:hypothetical protein ABPG74_002821 [Tetrahymena malaccensis]
MKLFKQLQHKTMKKLETYYKQNYLKQICFQQNKKENMMAHKSYLEGFFILEEELLILKIFYFTQEKSIYNFKMFQKQFNSNTNKQNQRFIKIIIFCMLFQQIFIEKLKNYQNMEVTKQKKNCFVTYFWKAFYDRDRTNRLNLKQFYFTQEKINIIQDNILIHYNQN